MPLVLANRVQETTATTGTGTITLAGAVSGYQSFAAIGNGNTTYYTITSGTAWEVGIGTYSTTGPTLARTTILSSSAGGAAITLVGVSTVFSTYPANRSVNYDETNSLTLSGTAISAPAWTTTGIGVKQVATTYTDTTSTGTVPNVYINSFAAQTLAATNTITVSQLYGIFFNTPTAGTNVTATERWSVGTDTLRVTGGILMDGGAGNFIQIATGMTTGQFILGNTAGTGTMTLGRSTVTQTINIQGGSTTSGNTKTINFGSGGLAGSTTNITIGSSVGTSTTTLNGTVSVASKITAALGSVTDPSYTFTGDTNTGMWSPGADTIAFSEGGVEAMRINSSGNVGIGTTAPGVGKLRVVQGASEVAFLSEGANSPGYPQFGFSGQTADNAGRGAGMYLPGDSTLAFSTLASERLRIDSAGNVGVGTATPVQRLHVRQDQDGTTAALIQNRNGSGTPISAVQFISGAFDLSDNRYAMISSAGGSNTRLQFWTGQGATPTERMRITDAGSVGIGETAPGARLHVSGGTVGTTAGNLLNVTIDQGLAGGNAVGIRTNLVRVSSGTDWTTTAMRLQGRVDATDFGYIDLVSGGAQGLAFGSSTSERMRIDSSGNVGIGTSTPVGRLQLAGTGSGFTSPEISLQNQTVTTGRTYAIISGDTGPLRFQDVTANAERMRIDSGGNVGIGTTAPGAKLDVLGISLARTDASGGNSPLVAKNDSAANNTTKSTGLLFQGVDTVGTGKSTGLVQCGPSDANYVASYLAFQTRAADALSERMRITSAGNVGIGTTAPLTRLFVEVPSSVGAAFAYASNSNGAYPSDVFGGSFGYNFSAGGAEVDFWNGWTGATGTQGGFAFRRQTGASSQNLLMTIRGDGNVGIGTASPLYQATVFGLGQETAALTDAGNKGGSLYLQATGVTSGSGGAVLFGTTFGNQTPFAAIKGLVSDGSTNTTGDLAISTRNAIADTALSERIRINSAGNVGIGTTNPGYRLDIASGDTTASLGYAMRIRSNATATAATIQFTNSAVSTQNGTITCTDAGVMVVQSDGASSILAFRTNGNERFRILSTGGITSGDLADAVGYKGVPQNSQTASYTLALSDMGKHISITTGGVVIPANGSVAFPVGSTITIYNNSASAQNISITTDTLRLAGTATSGTRSLAQRGLATCIKVASTEWVVTGNVT